MFGGEGGDIPARAENVPVLLEGKVIHHLQVMPFAACESAYLLMILLETNHKKSPTFLLLEARLSSRVSDVHQHTPELRCITSKPV